MKWRFQAPITTKAQAVENKIQADVFRAIYNLFGMETPGYLDANTKNYMDAYQSNPVVFGVINPIVKRCGTLKLTTEKGQETEVHKLLKRPNPTTSGTEFIQSVIANLAACGCAFIHKVKAGQRVIELWNVPAPNVTFITSDKLTFQSFTLQNSYRKEIAAEEMIFIRLPNPANTNPGENLTGLSPLRSCMNIITEVDEAVKANAKLLKNMRPAAMISATTPNSMIQDQVDEIANQIKKISGGSNAGSILATSAPVKITPFGLSPVDLNIHETLKRAKRDIGSVYGVPFEYFEPSTYSNKNDAKQDFINNAVLPIFNTFIDAINTDPDLFNMAKTELMVDIQDIPELRKDFTTLSTALAACWWLNGNEKRQAMDYEEDSNPLMNEIMIPQGMMPIDQTDMQNNPYVAPQANS